MPPSDAPFDGEFRGGYSLLVIEGRSGSFGLPATAVAKVTEFASFRGEAPLDLTEMLELDPRREPARVLEVRTRRGPVHLKTFGPVALRIVPENEVLELPALVRRQPGAALIDRVAVIDGVVKLWILDPNLLFRGAE
jgi:hypothetical protein